MSPTSSQNEISFLGVNETRIKKTNSLNRRTHAAGSREPFVMASFLGACSLCKPFRDTNGQWELQGLKNPTASS